MLSRTDGWFDFAWSWKDSKIIRRLETKTRAVPEMDKFRRAILSTVPTKHSNTSCRAAKILAVT